MRFRGAVSVAALGSVCALANAGCGPPSAAETAPPLQCPGPAHVERVEFPDERGGGFAERCLLADGRTRHGPSREFDGEGRLRGETHWWQGLLHGENVFWHANGQKRNVARHYRQQPVGEWTQWGDSGQVEQERDFGPPDLDLGSWPRPELGLPPDALPGDRLTAAPGRSAAEDARPAESATPGPSGPREP